MHCSHGNSCLPPKRNYKTSSDFKIARVNAPLIEFFPRFPLQTILFICRNQLETFFFLFKPKKSYKYFLPLKMHLHLRFGDAKSHSKLWSWLLKTHREVCFPLKGYTWNNSKIQSKNASKNALSRVKRKIRTLERKNMEQEQKRTATT